ncbi:uncharacterized protein LOC114245435 [Bombyx mandarina]|uniref:Uncharacterized protein LOC114245435 n=1 Tax=Bombyx mandarina TaxID=7092 RepID=A0A6J2JUY3_BOMMA|nr:uncharacterized protein LOC114245435 [Bombyx mandarina]
MEDRVLKGFVLICVFGSVVCDLEDFFGNFPVDVKNEFFSAWDSLIDAIKQPVRIKRLGSDGKHKTWAIPATTASTTTILKTITTEPSITKLAIPILPVPRWSFLERWRGMEVPRIPGFVKARHFTGPQQYKPSLTDEDNFGVLMFI